MTVDLHKHVFFFFGLSVILRCKYNEGRCVLRFLKKKSFITVLSTFVATL